MPNTQLKTKKYIRKDEKNSSTFNKRAKRKLFLNIKNLIMTTIPPRLVAVFSFGPPITVQKILTVIMTWAI